MTRSVKGRTASPPFTKLVGGMVLLASMAASCSQKKSRPRQEEDEAPSPKEDSAPPLQREVLPLFPNGDPSSIPRSVGAVRRFDKRFLASPAQGFREPYTPEAGWSRMAQEVCRGADVYQQMIMSGTNAAGTTLGKTLKDVEAARSQLECGRAVYEAMGGAVRQFFVTTNGAAIDSGPGASFARVGVRDIDLERLPTPAAITSQDSLGDLEGVFCPGTDKPTCVESANLTGRVRGRKIYLTGGPDEAKALATALLGASPNHPHAQAWASMAMTLPRQSTQEVGIGRAFRLGFIYGLGVFQSTITKLEKEPVAKSSEKLLRDDVETYGLADSMFARGGTMVLVFVPSKDSDAVTVATALTSWQNELIAAIGKVGSGSISKDGMPEAEVRFAALFDIWARRSIEEARVVANDGRVTMTFERRLTAEETATVDAMEEIFLKRSRRGAELVKMLLRGESPPDRLFEGVGATKFAENVHQARKQ